MLHSLKRHIESQGLFNVGNRLLLAVSGGVDSVVLCHLIHDWGLDFGIAHCNFQLRGADSDEDALFVQRLAQQLAVPFYCTTFDTKTLLLDSKESTQSLARQLRYDWFEELRRRHHYDYILTGHHQNDQAETILAKLAKGTGVRGMRGILDKQGHYVRPLLHFKKQMIEQYAQQKQIAFRKDISNDSTDYERNYIRHEIIPKFEKINPRFVEKMAKNSHFFKDLEGLLQAELARCKAQAVSVRDGILTIDYLWIRSQVAAQTLLFELLHEYGFNGSQVEQIQAAFPENGKQFFSDTHQLIIHQQQLLLRPLPIPPQATYELDASLDSFYVNDNKLFFKRLETPPIRFETSKDYAYFDFDKIEFPLKLRKWQAGDSFQPFGMKGNRQKVQDYFSDRKLSLFEKEATWILESGGQICWLVGWRSDERFRVDSETKRVLRLRWCKDTPNS